MTGPLTDFPDPKHDISIAVVDVYEHDLDVIDYDSFNSDLDDGINSERRSGNPKSFLFEIHNGGCFTITRNRLNVLPFLRPRLGLDYGLNSLTVDADVLELVKHAKDNKIILVYVKHGSTNVDSGIFVTPKNGVGIAVDNYLRKDPIEIDSSPDVNRNLILICHRNLTKEWEEVSFNKALSIGEVLKNLSNKQHAFSDKGPIVVETDDPFDDLDEILRDYANTENEINRNEIIVHVGNSSTVENVVNCDMLYETGGVGPMGNFKEVEVDADNEKSAESDLEENDTNVQDQMQKQFDVRISKMKAFRAKRIASDTMTGSKAKCDILLNNICEVFNRQLVDDKDQPIITCLEYIREYLMKRIVVVQKVIAKIVGPLTPTVTGIFDAIKKAATDYIVDWNGWELTRIPCKHVVAAIYNMFENGMGVGILEHRVHAAYRLEIWAHVYSFKINPCNGREMWLVVESRTVIIPPIHKPQVGMPPKKRKKSVDELARKAKRVKVEQVKLVVLVNRVKEQDKLLVQGISLVKLLVLVNKVKHKDKLLVQGMPQVKLVVLVNREKDQAKVLV
ncbi:hypothetical protein Tco_0450404 [Tanacetum coccineum]